MKKNLIILIIAQCFILNSFSQKTVYYLSEMMKVGCNGANPLTDLTKKITISFNAPNALLSFGSLNCKFEEKCSNFGSLNSAKGGILYMNDDLDIGFISEKDEKILLIRKDDGAYKIAGVANINKAVSGSVSEETANYQNELNNLKAHLNSQLQVKKIQELNALTVADSTNTFLDKQPILKDSRGMSGIYYSTFPIRLNYSDKYAKKFLINYDESSKNPVLYINSQYAYETTDRARFVKRASFWLDAYWSNVLSKTGVFATSEADNVDNDKYEFFTHSERKDLQGNSIFGDDILTNFDGNIYEVEPGILFIVGSFQDTKSFSEDLARAKKYGVIAILYKAEKAAAVKKYTNDVAWDKVKEMDIKIESAGNATTANLPAETFKDPKINAEALTFAKDYAAKNHPKEQVQYTYIAGNDWNIVRDKNSGAIIKRTLRIIVVVKIGNQCAFENGSISQNYDGANYGRSTWGGSGAPVYVDCKNLKQ